jgi:hypothetical protein
MSVDYCQRTGRSELAYDILNLEHLGDECHRKLEANTNELREAFYHFRSEGILENNEIYTFNEFLKQYKF